jgi:hypothetical protein
LYLYYFYYNWFKSIKILKISTLSLDSRAFQVKLKKIYKIIIILKQKLTHKPKNLQPTNRIYCL